MKVNRFLYFIIILVVIIAGILSRKITSIPFFIGDILYAVMVYFGIRFLFIPLNKMKTACIALMVCFCIECFQLYDAKWLITLRTTLFGRYVLGQGFLWSDLVAYTIGVAIAYFCEILLYKKS